MKMKFLLLPALVAALVVFTGGFSAFAQIADIDYWQGLKNDIEGEGLFILFGCFEQLDFELLELLEAIENQDAARVVDELSGDDDVPGVAEECNDLIDELQEAIDVLIDILDALEVGAHPAIEDDTLSYVQLKILYELIAVRAELEALAGVKDGILTALLALYNPAVDPYDPTGDPYAVPYSCVLLSQVLCNDLIDVIGATGVNAQQQQLLWAQAEELVTWLIFAKETAVVFFFGDVFSKLFAEFFGPVDFDLTLLDLLDEINREVDCLRDPFSRMIPAAPLQLGDLDDDEDDDEDCEAWYAPFGAIAFGAGGSIAALASEPLSVTSTYATPNPASASQSQVKFVAEGTGIAEVQVEIYDLAGGKVYESGFQQGNALSWNLLSNAGQPVANGVYLYVVTAQGQNGEVARGQVHKLVVLK